MKKKIIAAKNKKALVKALLRADDDCTYAISRLVDARNEIDAIVRVIELELKLEARDTGSKADEV